MLTLEKFSFGVGDRFGHQARAQLSAFQDLQARGVEVVPVWNKSNREHTFIGSEPSSVLQAAQAAVKSLGWTRGWHVDADHIRLETVDRFLPHSDFFTIDVADSIGRAPEADLVAAFVQRHPELQRPLRLPGIADAIEMNAGQVATVAAKYLLAVGDAGKIYRHILSGKGGDSFIAEVSMDETDLPQTPPELLVILAALADEGVPVQTIAPKFTGRFNKGVDYVGDLVRFEKEFREDLAVVKHAVQTYGLPTNLKLSVHSGSDKFSLYPIIRRVLAETGAGLHVKTAGTTWLEELIGLAEAGGAGLGIAVDIYEHALDHIAELCGPYASVIDIDRTRLPAVAEVKRWDGGKFSRTLRHIPGCPDYNPNFRQLLHVAFKLAAKEGARYTDLLKSNEAIVARNVKANILERHLLPLFIG